MKTISKTKSIILMAFAVVIVACNHEKSEDEVEVQADHTIDYVVANAEIATTEATANIFTEEDLAALLDLFCDYAAQGKAVSFRGHRKEDDSAKKVSEDAVTFSSTSRDEMRQWMASREELSMTVTVTFNNETGTWNGIAYSISTTSQSTDGHRIRHATMDFVLNTYFDKHFEYFYYWEGDYLVNIDMIEDVHNIYYSDMHQVDTVFHTHNNAVLTYDDDNLLKEINIYNADGDLLETHQYSYIDSLLILEWRSDEHRTYTFRYTSEGDIEDWLITDALYTWPSYYRCEWENGDVVRTVNRDNTVYCTLQYDGNRKAKSMNIGTTMLLPGYNGCIPVESQLSQHNLTRLHLGSTKSESTGFTITYEYSDDKPVSARLERDEGYVYRWTFEYYD